MLEWQSRVQTLVCTLFEENIPCGIANSLRWKVALLLTSSGSPLAIRANQSWVDHLNREWKKVIVENGMKLRNRTDFIRIHQFFFPDFCCGHHFFRDSFASKWPRHTPCTSTSKTPGRPCPWICLIHFQHKGLPSTLLHLIPTTNPVPRILWYISDG